MVANQFLVHCVLNFELFAFDFRNVFKCLNEEDTKSHCVIILVLTTLVITVFCQNVNSFT